MRGFDLNRVVFVCAACAGASATVAQAIDFETLPDGSAVVDNQVLPLDSAYSVPFDGGTVEVTLGFDVDGDGVAETPAVFEAVGDDPVTAFDGFGADGPRAEFADQLGMFFLRSESALHNPAPVGVLIAAYSQPVPGCGGEIWDIDGPEQWEVRGYRAGEAQPSASIVSPLGGLNGEPWVFSLADFGVGFSRLEIEHIGTRPFNALGLAFNNFSASESIPGPTLLTTQPLDEVRNQSGFEEVTLYWSVPVTLSASDVSVVTADPLGQPVPISITGSGTQATTIVFRGLPGGGGGGANDPLVNGVYQISVGGLARATATNIPIDGDNDGIAGGAAVFTVAHRCLADLAAPAGLLDLSDITAFVQSFTTPCE